MDPFPSLTLASETNDSPLSDGDLVDIQLGNEGGDDGNRAPTESTSSPRNRISRTKTSSSDDNAREPREPTGKPPTLDEWTHFFGRVVLRITCDWYLSWSFRGVDDELISDRDLERLELSDDERKTISVPLAELSNKSKFMRKHGRTMVASGDAIHAMVVIGAWMSRVNRIAAKYRPKQTTIKVNGMGNQNGSSRQNESAPNTFATGTGNGRVPNGYTVYPSNGG